MSSKWTTDDRYSSRYLLKARLPEKSPISVLQRAEAG